MFGYTRAEFRHLMEHIGNDKRRWAAPGEESLKIFRKAPYDGVFLLRSLPVRDITRKEAESFCVTIGETPHMVWTNKNGNIWRDNKGNAHHFFFREAFQQILYVRQLADNALAVIYPAVDGFDLAWEIARRPDAIYSPRSVPLVPTRS